MRRDRDGSLLDEDDIFAPVHSCTNGWLPEGVDGLPRPCLTCKPWLTPGTTIRPPRFQLASSGRTR